MLTNLSDRKLSELFSLSGKTAVITGGAKGIGLATAKRIAELGAHVILADMDIETAQKEAAIFKSQGLLASATQLRLPDEQSINDAADFAVKETGHLDIWCNIAGIYPVSDTMSIKVEDWRKVLDINLLGSFLGSRAGIRKMIEGKRKGVVINIHSTTAWKTVPGLPHYIASKGGIEAMTRALAVEFGPNEIRVVGVSPTMTETPGMDSQKADLDKAFGGVDSHQVFGSRLPLGRTAYPDEIARVIAMLCTDLSQSITGSIVAADLGDSAF
ncbi:MAG: SDR family oxidoreductase [Bacteroidia bacterium]|nr:SDR family oxidoreductase [Bacteroidia bacterium]